MPSHKLSRAGLRFVSTAVAILQPSRPPASAAAAATAVAVATASTVPVLRPLSTSFQRPSSRQYIAPRALVPGASAAQLRRPFSTIPPSRPHPSIPPFDELLTPLPSAELPPAPAELLARLKLVPASSDVFVALGSNLGDKASNLQLAVRRLATLPHTTVLAVSPMYASQPFYVTDQPVFANAAVRLRSALSPHSLLVLLKWIEETMGRRPTIRNGPRLIDLDLLLHGDRLLAGAVDAEVDPLRRPLSLPHVSIAERVFVLQPLAALLTLREWTHAAGLDEGSCGQAGSHGSHSRHGGRGGHGGAARRASQRLADWRHPRTGQSLEDLLRQCPSSPLTVVTPMRRTQQRRIGDGEEVWSWGHQTRIMGILNCTPDSFSDGGRFPLQASSPASTSSAPLPLSAEEAMVAADPAALLALPAAVRAAVTEALLLAEAGADVIDVGGQSTRPGAVLVDEEEERRRVVPVVAALKHQLDAWEQRWAEVASIPTTTTTATSSSSASTPSTRQSALAWRASRPLISIDTFRASVAAAAVRAGGDIVNDVTGGSLDPVMLTTVAALGVPYILMHMRGEPADMQSAQVLASYATTSTTTTASTPTAVATATPLSHEGPVAHAAVFRGIQRDMRERVARAVAAGIPLWHLLLDPGLGFAKPPAVSAALLLSARAACVPASLPLPVLVGSSRKSFLAHGARATGLDRLHRGQSRVRSGPAAGDVVAAETATTVGATPGVTDSPTSAGREWMTCASLALTVASTACSVASKPWAPTLFGTPAPVAPATHSATHSAAVDASDPWSLGLRPRAGADLVRVHDVWAAKHVIAAADWALTQEDQLARELETELAVEAKAQPKGGK